MFLSKPMLGTQLDWSNPLNNPVLDLLFNEGHGDRVNDLSGYGNHGTLHGFDFPPTVASGWGPGVDGVALNFDGVDDYIDCGNGPSLRITHGITMDALVYPRSFTFGTDDEGGIINKENAYRTLLEGAALTTRWATSEVTWGDGKRCGFTLPEINRWYRLTVTYDEYIEKVRFYLNGVLSVEKTLTGSIAINNNDVVLGHAGIDYLYASVARIRILPRCMSAFEIMRTQIDPYGMYQQ